MEWLDPPKIKPSECDPEVKVSEFIRTSGPLGRVALEAWDTVNPLGCLYIPDEYLGYARRFIKETGRFIPSEWETFPGLVEELVRRSFGPTQVVCHFGLGRPFVEADAIKTIAEIISRGVARLGGWTVLRQTDLACASNGSKPTDAS